MEFAIQVQIDELPEGLFLATSHDLSGLVAQGRTVAEALEIARDVLGNYWKRDGNVKVFRISQPQVGGAITSSSSRRENETACRVRLKKHGS